MIKKILSVFLLLLASPAFAAITDVADSTDHAATQSSRTPAEPAGVIEDDLIIAFCTINIEDGTWTDPADFTQVDNVAAGANINNHSYVGYKVRAATAGSGYLFSYSGTASNIRCSLQAFRGQDTATPLDVTYVQGTHRNENDQDAAATASQAITTVTDNAWACLLQYTTDQTFTSGMPTGYTEYLLAQSANRSQVVACKAIASAGVETPGAWTHTGVESTQDSINFTLAIMELAVSSASTLLLLGPD